MAHKTDSHLAELNPNAEYRTTYLTGVNFHHGEMYLNVSPLAFQHDGNWQVGGAGSFGDAGYISSTAAGYCVIPIPMRADDRVKAFAFARYGDGAADITSVEFNKLDKDGAVTNLAPATSVTDPIASWIDTTVDLTDTLLDASDTLFVRFAVNAANIRIGAMRVLFDRPSGSELNGGYP